MKLYVCHATSGSDHHGCARAYRAVVAAGYDPEVVKARGSGFLPGLLQNKKRKKLKELTGSYFTPVLVLDDGEVINTSDKIAAWAAANQK